MTSQVISLYDYTGEALRPWAEAGYDCYAYDIQHKGSTSDDMSYEGRITYIHADLYNSDTLLEIIGRHGTEACFMSAFPPCTDLASSGATWWKKKQKPIHTFRTRLQPMFSSVCLLVRRWVARSTLKTPLVPYRNYGGNGITSLIRATTAGICQRTTCIRDIQRSFRRGMRIGKRPVFGRVAVS